MGYSRTDAVYWANDALSLNSLNPPPPFAERKDLG